MRGVNMAGMKCGRWFVVKRAAPDAKQYAQWLCRCTCGTERIVRGTELRYGASRSCGCLMQDVARTICIQRNSTHGLSKTPTYRIWKGMNARCNNPENLAYHRYGGRGITVCRAWEDFANFYKDMGPCPDGLSLDRINNDGDYEPGNCRWASRSVQSNNTRRNRKLRFKGRTMNLAQWATEIGVTTPTLWKRLRRGLPLAQALKKGK